MDRWKARSKERRGTGEVRSDLQQYISRFGSHSESRWWCTCCRIAAAAYGEQRWMARGQCQAISDSRRRTRKQVGGDGGAVPCNPSCAHVLRHSTQECRMPRSAVSSGAVWIWRKPIWQSGTARPNRGGKDHSAQFRHAGSDCRVLEVVDEGDSHHRARVVRLPGTGVGTHRTRLALEDLRDLHAAAEKRVHAAPVA